MDTKKKITGPHSPEYIAKYGDAHLKRGEHGDHGHRGEKGDAGPQGERGPAGPVSVVCTLRLWMAIIVLAAMMAGTSLLAGAQISRLEHRIDAAQSSPK